MKLPRILGCLLILAGTLSCVLGMESAVRGAMCEVGPAMTPALCIPAHQAPPQAIPFVDDTPAGCINYFYLWCWPDPAIGCWTEGYGIGVNGYCEHYLAEAAYGLCFEDYNEGIVQLQYHRSECEFLDALCECIWITGEYAPYPYPVCDCATTP